MARWYLWQTPAVYRILMLKLRLVGWLAETVHQEQGLSERAHSNDLFGSKSTACVNPFGSELPQPSVLKRQMLEQYSNIPRKVEVPGTMCRANWCSEPRNQLLWSPMKTSLLLCSAHCAVLPLVLFRAARTKTSNLKLLPKNISTSSWRKILSWQRALASIATMTGFRITARLASKRKSNFKGSRSSGWDRLRCPS